MNQRGLLITLIALSGVLAWQWSRTNQALVSHRGHVGRLSSEILELRTLVDGMVQGLTAEPTEACIRGRSATTGELIETPVTGAVLSLIQTQCSACAANVSQLNRLHAEGFGVWGIVPKESIRSIRSFIEATGSRFDILRNPSGVLLDRLPRNAVPLTVAVRGGEVRGMWLGVLDEEDVQDLRTLLLSEAGQ